jgi:ABC-type multidrug transport system fused ATPase/permease subunit
MMVGSVISPELEKDIHEGDIKFVDVDFKYPTREEFLFKKFNLHIKPGQKVALVG